jgi:hypothetical protein
MVSDISSTETTRGAGKEFSEKEENAPRCLGNEPRNPETCEDAATSLDDIIESMVVPL